MKYAIVADVHLWNHKRHGGALVRGINRRAQLGLDVLRRAVSLANEEDAKLIVAGDLVDSAGPIQPQLAAAIRGMLAGCVQGASLVLGNHDMTSDGDHSLGVYEQLALNGRGVTVISKTQWHRSDSAINYPLCAAPFHCDITDPRIRDTQLLVGHFGVYDSTFPPFLRASKEARNVDDLFSYMKERNIRCMMLGDWHRRMVWSRHDGMTTAACGLMTMPEHKHDMRWVMQVGSLCPTGWDNAGLDGYGTVALWDAETQELTWRVLPGPRFCVVRSADEEESIIAGAKRRGDTLFLRRYYEGEKPETPLFVEAYEAIPIAVEVAATYARARESGTVQRGVTVEALVSEWLASAATPTDEAQVLQQKIKEYLGS
jgi:hypothetical protein